jgi:hypothetical protein
VTDVEDVERPEGDDGAGPGLGHAAILAALQPSGRIASCPSKPT